MYSRIESSHANIIRYIPLKKSYFVYDYYRIYFQGVLKNMAKTVAAFYELPPWVEKMNL